MQDDEIKLILIKILEPEAYERLANIRLVNEELYKKAAELCMQMYNRYGKKISDKILVEILYRLKGQDKDPEIRIKRK
jgi:DNA-binding TFAR19-related protein (PDSD5 family)